MIDISQNENNIRTSHLDQRTSNELRQIIKPFKKIFYNENDDLTFTHKIKHEIKTVNDVPIYTKLYRYPEIHWEEVEKQVEEMLKQGIIRHSDSPYCAVCTQLGCTQKSRCIPKTKVEYSH